MDLVEIMRRVYPTDPQYAGEWLWVVYSRVNFDNGAWKSPRTAGEVRKIGDFLVERRWEKFRAATHEWRYMANVILRERDGHLLKSRYTAPQEITNEENSKSRVPAIRFLRRVFRERLLREQTSGSDGRRLGSGSRQQRAHSLHVQL